MASLRYGETAGGPPTKRRSAEAAGLSLNEVAKQTGPNQAMQLTASKPAIYAFTVCRRERRLRGMHSGLAAADLVSR